MIVELHMLQNFVPSNLNRDDTGSPKDCIFGGHRRARISSQCLKRAIRSDFSLSQGIKQDFLAERTKRASEEIGKRLAQRGRPEAGAKAVAARLIGELGIKMEDDGRTKYLLFLADSEINAAVESANTHWDALSSAIAQEKAQEKGKTRAELPRDIKNELIRRLDGGRAADLALFGRMIADIAERNVDGASQVAHAISTNKIEIEFDFYTAVDDLKPDDTAGADMLGTVEFNSACFYRYANVDLAQLTKNLGRDAHLAQRTLEAFLRASINAIPTGKQNSMAAHNPPSLVLAVVREHGQWNLANAFLKPIRPSQNSDLVDESITALDVFWNKLTTMYGPSDLHYWVATTEPQCLNHLAPAARSSVEQVVYEVLASSSPQNS